jgi:hypothetical protein
MSHHLVKLLLRQASPVSARGRSRLREERRAQAGARTGMTDRVEDAVSVLVEPRDESGEVLVSHGPALDRAVDGSSGPLERRGKCAPPRRSQRVAAGTLGWALVGTAAPPTGADWYPLAL